METRRGIRILHLAGDPHERGYQHGRLLKDEIEYSLTRGLTGAAAVTANARGCTVDEGFATLRTGARLSGEYLPDHLEAEMRGIVDGLADAGSDITFEDILTWNTMYDTWCFYAHPDPARPETDYPVESPGCSSFSAWGPATVDGSLGFGKNMDNLDLPGIPEGRTLVFSRPDNGAAFVNNTLAGMLAIDGGMNEHGCAVMTHYSPSVHESMRGLGIGALSRLILEGMRSVKDAETILKTNRRCTGINWHAVDARRREAAVIEVSAAEAAVRRPEADVLWTTNHSNCYPGWMGYDGLNMVEFQQPVYRLADIGSIEAWQKSLADRDSPWISGTGRFERYRRLLKEHHGSISPETGKTILSDRVDPDTGLRREWDTPARGRNDGITISILGARKEYARDIPVYRGTDRLNIAAQAGNLWSMIATPETGDFAVAMKGFPAHRHGWVSFNLFEELEKH